MSEKRKTISTRWREWAFKEPKWAYSALICFALSMAGLVMHLGVLSGLWRTVGLWMLIGFDVGLLGITAFRKQWWWFTFFVYITVGVIGWEIASYFFG
jgi:hypothetical protein